MTAGLIDEVETANPALERARAALELSELVDVRRRDDMQPLRPAARRYVYELRISAGKTLRIRRSDLAAPDFAACQRFAAHAALLDYDALIVPTGRADGANVVIFVAELAADTTFERVSVTDRSETLT